MCHAISRRSTRTSACSIARRLPPETLQRARQIACKNGVRYAYVGNVHDPEADSTYCHACGAVLIARDWYEVTGWRLESNRCPGCGAVCAGVFEARPGNWGRQRLPVQLRSFRPQESQP